MNIPPDVNVTLIIYKYVHTHNLNRVNQEYHQRYQLSEYRDIVLNIKRNPMYNWRDLIYIAPKDLDKFIIYDKNNRKTKHRLPLRYI